MAVECANNSSSNGITYVYTRNGSTWSLLSQNMYYDSTVTGKNQGTDVALNSSGSVCIIVASGCTNYWLATC